jgi:uncharacterized protein (TIGR02145 family)
MTSTAMIKSVSNTRLKTHISSKYFVIIILIKITIFSGCKPENNNIIPSVTTTEITEIRDTSAVVNGNISSEESAAIFDRGFVWSTSETPTINDLKETVGSGNGNFSSFIGELQPGTVYYTCAYAKTDDDIYYGNILSFRTFDTTGTTSTYTDYRDGITYPTITLGYQVWMTGNLKYLPSVCGIESVSGSSPKYYVYDYNGTDTAEAKTLDSYVNYGVLYNWTAAQISCPEGWHLPTDADWRKLEMFLGMSYQDATDSGLRGNNEGGQLKALTNWNNPNSGATNSTGFSALPGGSFCDDNSFNDIGNNAYWWTASDNGVKALYRFLSYDNAKIGRLDKASGNALSVRCVKD